MIVNHHLDTQSAKIKNITCVQEVVTHFIHLQYLGTYSRAKNMATMNCSFKDAFERRVTNTTGRRVDKPARKEV